MTLSIYPYLNNCNNILGQSGTIGFNNDFWLTLRPKLSQLVTGKRIDSVKYVKLFKRLLVTKFCELVRT